MGDYGKYVLAQGENAARRLEAIHKLWGAGMMQISMEAGLKPGMTLADFGCGVGTALASFASYLGPAGHVTGIDISGDQLREAGRRLEQAGAGGFRLMEASADRVPMEDQSVDFVYARYLLIHLTHPMAAVREMLRVLKPGGVLFIDDGDLTTCFSFPPSAGDEFARIFGELSKNRGVDYTLGRRLHSLLLESGVKDLQVRVEQPGYLRGDEKRAIAWSIEEAKPSVISCGLHTEEEIDAIVEAMHRAVEDETILFVVPRMTRAWGRKPVPVV